MRMNWISAAFSGVGAVFVFVGSPVNAQPEPPTDAGPPSELIEDKVDRFTGIRTISFHSKDGPVNKKPRVNFVASLKDGQLTEAMIVLSMFSVTDRRSGSGWQYLRCHNVYWLIDGEPLSLGDASHHGDTSPRGGLIEIITQRASEAELRRFENSSSIEYKICNDEFKASETDIAGVRAGAARTLEAIQNKP